MVHTERGLTKTSLFIYGSRVKQLLLWKGENTDESYY